MSASPHDDTRTPGRSWASVTRHDACPICGHDSWCEVASDGTVHCMRIDNGGPAWDKRQGGWLHRPSTPRAPAPSPATGERLAPAPCLESADDPTKDAIYARLLELCPPALADRDYLLRKAGHTDAMIVGNYGTLPRQDAQGALMTTLVSEFGADILRTVPGVVDVGNGHLRWRGAGLLIAVRDLAGRITACRVRAPLENGDKAYFWLSSTKSGGPSSGAPAHVARPPELRDHRIYFCESEKTATYLAHTRGAVAVALAGQGNHRAALAVAEELRDAEDAEVAVVLLDAVDSTNVEATRKEAETDGNRQALAASLARLGYHVKIGRWARADGKGPDDLLLAGHTFAYDIYTPPFGRTDDRPHPGVFAPAPDDAELVSVDPCILAWMLTQTASTATLRARYHHQLAILRDGAMNDGQKLANMAIAARLPVGRGTRQPEPVIITAAAIACDLGSRVTVKDGIRRPTRLNTVTKNLGDLVNLGVLVREAVEVPKVITVTDDQGRSVETTITTTKFAYQDTGSLPGQHMSRDEAREAATRAKTDRERPRCPRCYSKKLKPSAHVCLDCGQVSSDVDAVYAAQALVDHGDGLYTHRDTGEIVVPGVVVETIDPVRGIRVQDPKTEQHSEEEPCTRIPGTKDVFIPVPGIRVQGSDASGDDGREILKPCGGGCGTLTPRGWTCGPCLEKPFTTTPLHIPNNAATEQGVHHGS